MQHHSSKYLLALGGKREQLIFSESSLVACQIKRCRAPLKQIVCPYTRPQSLGWNQKVIFFSFLNVVMLHIFSFSFLKVVMLHIK